VNSYLIREEQFLLLKRNNPPKIWGPPGGRLNLNEDPVSGLIREVWEETRLEVIVGFPITSWFGDYNDQKILSIDYLCRYKSGNIQLSSEHDHYKWLSIKELRNDEKTYLSSLKGFKLFDFELAWSAYKYLSF